MKKLISLALCAVMAAGSAVCANAAQLPQHKGVEILNSSIHTQNNTLNVYTYNMKSNSTGGIMLKGKKTGKEYKIYFKDCISNCKTLALPSGQIYDAQTMVYQGGGSAGRYNLEKTGGEYVKVKVKLHDIAPDFFNSNGTHTEYGHNYNFAYEKANDGYYESVLFFTSGGVVTGVTPDSNGYAQIYISTKPGDTTEYVSICSFEVGLSSGICGGTSGTEVYDLMFGNMNFDYSLNVNDVTTLQQYLAGEKEFDSLQYFYADINRDGRRDVTDVTALQTAISG